MSPVRKDSSTRDPISELYRRFILDPMVEVARAVSHDFVRNPSRYRGLPENLVSIFSGFRNQSGSDVNWPSGAQRADLFGPVFGHAFRSTSTDLMEAAVSLVDRSVDKESDAHADRIRDSAIAFREHLRSIDRSRIVAAVAGTDSVFQSAVEVFKSEGIARLYGLSPIKSDLWPFDGTTAVDSPSASGGLLIEEVQRAIRVFDNGPLVTHHLFALFQNVAHYGSQTIDIVLSDSAGWNKPNWAQNLSRTAYNWEKSLQAAFAYIEKAEGKSLQPRAISKFPLDDAALRSLADTSDLESSATIARLGNQAPGNTCTYGWTRICDNPGPGQSCTYGWTWYCDTGPTCTTGWTLMCDSRPTCTYGWTFKCDSPSRYL